MTERGRREYAAVMRARYAPANKQARGRLLSEYCRTTGCHRKAAIRRLRTPPHPARRSPGHPCRYPARELAPILERAWLASDQLSGKLLRPLLPVLLTALVTHHGLRMSPAVPTALTTATRTGCCVRCAAGARANLGASPAPSRPSGPRSPCARGVSGPAWRPARCKATLSCIVASPRRDTIARRSSQSTWPPRGPTCSRSGACTGSASPAGFSTSPCACRFRCASGTVTMAAGACQRLPARLVSAARRPLHPRPALPQERPGLGRAAQWPPRPPPRWVRSL